MSIEDTIPDSFIAFMEDVRGAYPELAGNDAQIAELIASALDIVNPETSAAESDAVYLSVQFHYLASLVPGEVEYPEEDENDDGHD